MKYNWSIIGHEKQLKQIEADLESGNLSHAYLLSGPNSVGKLTVARKMAGILQCEGDFCHTCPTCLQVARGGHLDTLELTGKESIKIEEVRKLIERVNTTKQSKYRVVIVQSVERMTTAAANSFLKVLEEPPAGTIFILTTNEMRAVLPTIISRVRVVKFANVSVGYLREELRARFPEVEDEVLEKVCLFSMGKTGKALQLMERPDSLASYVKVYHEVLNFLDHRNVAERFQYVEDLVGEEGDLDLFFGVLIHVLRSKMLDGEDADVCATRIAAAAAASNLLKKNVNSRLVLENLMLSL